jgi:hypothetical protein
MENNTSGEHRLKARIETLLVVSDEVKFVKLNAALALHSTPDNRG